MSSLLCIRPSSSTKILSAFLIGKSCGQLLCCLSFPDIAQIIKILPQFWYLLQKDNHPNNIVRLFNECPGNRYTLFLTTRQRNSPLAKHRVKLELKVIIYGIRPHFGRRFQFPDLLPGLNQRQYYS